MPEPSNLRKQIGPAIWLLILLVQHTSADWTGADPAWVAGGNVVSDSELVSRLQISVPALAGWRRRLRRLGLLGWLLSPRHGRAYWVAGIARVFADSQPAEQPAGTEGPKPVREPTAVVWKAVQERSIALTGKVVGDLNPVEGLRLADALAPGSKNPSESERERC